MSVFDYVTPPDDASCGRCGAPIGDAQSKDGDCLMATLPFTAVLNFYSICKQCRTWNEWNIKIPTTLTADDYEQSVYDTDPPKEPDA